MASAFLHLPGKSPPPSPAAGRSQLSASLQHHKKHDSGRLGGPFRKLSYTMPSHITISEDTTGEDIAAAHTLFAVHAVPLHPTMQMHILPRRRRRTTLKHFPLSETFIVDDDLFFHRYCNTPNLLIRGFSMNDYGVRTEPINNTFKELSLGPHCLPTPTSLPPGGLRFSWPSLVHLSLDGAAHLPVVHQAERITALIIRERVTLATLAELVSLRILDACDWPTTSPKLTHLGLTQMDIKGVSGWMVMQDLPRMACLRITGHSPVEADELDRFIISHPGVHTLCIDQDLPSLPFDQARRS
ncbi:hypothetical protein DFH07DRAFT_973856 [Mycena maculata]|uniref:Uncharacterized protein n=1 Tax=Mycena maculata TaxID=230809 RepID=A0AAD7HBA5_9AGAR|nr:hypothetical protein DFH07DRAFT_973856 [Mycena maculata]